MKFFLDFTSDPDRPFVWAENKKEAGAWIEGKLAIDKLNAFEKQSIERKQAPPTFGAVLVWYTSLWPYEFQT